MSQPEGHASPPDGPPCSMEGPTVEAVPVAFMPGKPPSNMFSFDAGVRNPLARPIWLIYEVNRGFPASVEIVSVDQTAEGPPRFLWTFRGDRSMQAVRVAAHADVIVRGLEFSSWGQELMTLVLASDVTIDGRPAFEWMGRQEDLPARGEMDMRSLATGKSRRVEPSGTQSALRVGVICTRQIDLWSEPVGKRRLGRQP